MSYEIGTATDFLDLVGKLDTFLTAKGQAFGLNYQGTGTGTMGSITGGASSVAETFVITATSATNFTVVGSVSGSIGPATVGTPFSHAKIAFTITAGGTAFIAGDVFTISTSPPAVRKRGVSTGSSTRWRINATKNEIGGTSGAGLRFARVEAMITAGGADQINGSGGTASQSNTQGSNTADKAADTDLSTFAETQAEVGWWQYDFLAAKLLVEIAITAPVTNPTAAPQDFTIEYWNGSAWVIAKSVRNETAWAASERRVYTLSEFVWELPGNDGLAEILVGVNPHRNAAAGWYNWRLNGFTAFDAAVDWFSQPGAISNADPYGPMIPLSNGSLGYWFIGNGRRVIGIVKSGSTYGAFYLGLILPYASPGQWPYPLFVGGSLWFEDEPTLSSTLYLVGNSHSRHTTFVLPFIPLIANSDLWPLCSSARLRKPDGGWKAFVARSDNYDIKDTPGLSGVWPYAWGFTNLKPDLDGKYSMMPVMLIERDPANWYGQLDGILAVTGSGLTAEAALDVPRTAPASGSDHYVAFPDVTRATAGDFFAVKLD